ncbi:PREDICTED: uncharacterized protein LOC109581956 [Amphimedon queenslandica]|uniref:Uncharacterized protein n=1 Tax=Amphimedon queenslandica TaxID=400682 RepID=A0AAN0J5M6_AMPQE|nr:PREDICTED: uncharacterized protein LOC109581956 [Amphimedon queenslandica]|eukprot:XP_019852028.1 PREDICTED: uncharacterized protein LOC109581956 [Amphimedon queenslandica]
MFPMKKDTKNIGGSTPFSKSSMKRLLISLTLAFLVLSMLYIWFRPQQQILIYNYYNSSKGGNLNSQAVVTNAAPLKFYSQDESLVDLLGNLTFKNYGIVKSTDSYVWREIPILYLEAQNVSGPYLGWADTHQANYLFLEVSGPYLTNPPSGMRSSVPLGGISTGNIELRGNFYTNLFKDSVDVAQKLGSDLSTTVSDIANLHTPFMKSSLPITLQDMLINSLSHVRSAFWLNDGRWRQWEAYDCVNIDSVHNDGERHIPYISIFPNSTISKLYAWAKYQESNGMIQEQLRCGCMTMTDKSPRVDSGCGRAMCDVSSMFIVYLLELLTWHDDPYSQQVVRDLYNASKKAAQWHMSVSTAEGIPLHLVDTYDIVNLAAYPYDTYSGSFHLLAMKAAETLAYAMGMYLPINALMIVTLNFCCIFIVAYTQSFP